MTRLFAPGITGPWPDASWLEEVDATGVEYGALFLVPLRARAEQWGLSVPAEEPGGAEVAPQADPMTILARELALASPRADSPRVAIPEMTGELLDDVHGATGLTYGQIAGMYGISERAVAGWKTQGVPSHRADLLRALRALGLTLIGGLGAHGVRTWLMAGHPSRLERIARGDLDDVVAEARSYEDSPYT